jgi:hypothetical protein
VLAEAELVFGKFFDERGDGSTRKSDWSRAIACIPSQTNRRRQLHPALELKIVAKGHDLHQKGYVNTS